MLTKETNRLRTGGYVYPYTQRTSLTGVAAAAEEEVLGGSSIPAVGLGVNERCATKPKEGLFYLLNLHEYVCGNDNIYGMYVGINSVRTLLFFCFGWRGVFLGSHQRWRSIDRSVGGGRKKH